MTKYCKTCHNPLSDAAKFCPRCGAPVQGDTCAQCGAELAPGGKFCAGCGAPRQVPPWAPLPPMQPPAPPMQPPASRKRAKSRTAGVIAIVAGVLALVVLGVFVVIPLIKRISGPNGAQKALETQTAVVSAENPVAELAGVRIDANAINLVDGEKTLTVIKKAPVTDEENECTYVEYDINLGETHNFHAPLTLTLPYEDALSGRGWGCIEHFDSDYGMWIPLDTRIDTAQKTATASLTSLSPVRMAYSGRFADSPHSAYYIRNNGHSDANLEVSYNYWQIIKGVPLKDAEDIANEFMQTGGTGQSLGAFFNTDTLSQVNTVYTVFGALGDATLQIVGGASPAAASVCGAASKAIGAIGLVIASVQLINDCATYGVQDARTGTNFLKNVITNSGALISFLAGYSSVALSVGLAAAVLIGMGIEYVADTADQIQADTTAAIFDTYYNDPAMPGYIDDTAWYRFFSNAYYTAWQNGAGTQESYEAAMAALKREIDRHADQFWNEVYRDGSDALTFAVAEAGKRNYYTPKPEHKAELTAKYKNDLYKRLGKVFSKWVSEFMLERLQKETFSALFSAAKPFNDYYHVTVQEIAPIDTAAPCKYQRYTIRFVCGSAGSLSFPVTDHPEEWILHAPEDDDQWAVETDFTMLGYIQAGQPGFIALFPPESDIDDLDAAERVVPFSLNTLGTPNVIDLSAAGVPTLAELAGRYADGTMTVTKVSEAFIALIESMGAAFAESLEGAGCEATESGGGEIRTSDLEGQTQSTPFTIVAHSETEGILIGEGNDGDAGEGPSGFTGVDGIPFTYDPASGAMTMVWPQEDTRIVGDLYAVFTEDNKIRISGTLRATLILPEESGIGVNESDSFYIDLLFTGTKPLEKGP